MPIASIVPPSCRLLYHRIRFKKRPDAGLFQASVADVGPGGIGFHNMPVVLVSDHYTKVCDSFRQAYLEHGYSHAHAADVKKCSTSGRLPL